MTVETKETIRTWTGVVSATCAVLGLALLVIVNWHALVLLF